MGPDENTGAALERELDEIYSAEGQSESDEPEEDEDSSEDENDGDDE